MANNVYLPEQFLSKIEGIMPSELSMQDFIDICQQPLRKSIRVNTLKISVTDFLARAETLGWQLEPVPWCQDGFWITRDDATPLGNSAEHLAGLFYIQEASSMMPVTALFHLFNNTEDAVLLDAAAAPGSKTTQIAAAVSNQGLVVANEFSASRIKGLYSNLQRCGIKNVALTNFDARVFGSWLPETFDAILLDAPCSGEGTVRKDPDAMKNWCQSAIDAIADTQKALIESAFYALKPGGTLIYSTCTLSQEENQHVCDHLLATFEGNIEACSLADLFPHAERSATAEGYLHIWPQIYDSEGFFVAGFRKTASQAGPKAKKRLGRFPFKAMNKKDIALFTDYLESQFGISQLEGQVFNRDNELWLFPEVFKPLIGQLKFDRVGIKLAEMFKKNYRLTHEWALALGSQATKGTFELSLEQCQEYYMGRDIRPESGLSGKGEVLLTYKGHTVGLGKWVNTRIKNNLPRELVKDGNLFTQ
ncbi:16S rRNA (cytosine(1407)-C(5))-methyltransferase RsmF [Motilimonas pumila]|uniref:Ribosomal RNA small subunit methyltransferase F n=1 Tax=Motilimonas pumila TaxID=2303987 RepID=A0A418YCP5_9GAMM|nr:16S rRNA (cytosine(1407)-C(5))-methyltransferase RsmF [Motilimonas pumila]RJG42262.1 16S rRNA (cytosine(1407)-C(5))-methyltransferase RsmF [Motilimonas pumila]